MMKLPRNEKTVSPITNVTLILLFISFSRDIYILFDILAIVSTTEINKFWLIVPPSNAV